MALILQRNRTTVKHKFYLGGKKPNKTKTRRRGYSVQ